MRIDYTQTAAHLHHGGPWGFDRGANVIPAILTGVKKKTPKRNVRDGEDDGWKLFQQTRMSHDHLSQYGWSRHDGVGVIHYGVWKCLDFDGSQPSKDSPKHPVDQSIVTSVMDGLNLRFDTYPWLQRTPSGGYHLWVWCEDDTPLSSWFGVNNQKSKDKDNVGEAQPVDEYVDRVGHVEVRWGGGCQTVIVGQRSDGRTYEFVNIGDHLLSHGVPQTPPAKVGTRQLREALSRVFQLPQPQLSTPSNRSTNYQPDGNKAQHQTTTTTHDSPNESPEKALIRERLNHQWMVEFIQQQIGDTTTETQGDGWVRVGQAGMGHGGWFVNPQTGGVCNHQKEFGGDVFDLIGFWKFYDKDTNTSGWDNTDRRMFSEVLNEAASHAGVKLSNSRRGRPSTASYGVTPKTWVLERFDFRTNMMSGETELVTKETDNSTSPTSWSKLNDRILNAWMVEYEEQVGRWVAKDRWITYIDNHHTSPPYDPIKLYFDDLTWDGEDHLTEFASLIQVEQPTLFLNHLRSWLLRAYVCGYYGGYGHRNDYVLILSGGQGVGKTTFLRTLIPKPLRPYTTSGALPTDDNEAKRKLANVFIYLNDELSTIGKVSSESLKSYLSEETLTYRPPYGKFYITTDRRFSMCGSTNEVLFLTDDTGNRRFLIHHMTRGDINGMRSFDVDKLWAQIQHLYQQGETGLFDEVEEQQNTTRNREHAIEKVESVILKRFTRPTTPIDDNAQCYTTGALCLELERRFDKSNTEVKRDAFGNEKVRRNNVTRHKLQPKVMGNILKSLGYEQSQRRVNGEKDPSRVWWVEWVNYEPEPITQVKGERVE